LLILLLAISVAILLLKSEYVYGVFLGSLAILLCFIWVRGYFRLYEYIQDFAESTKYHDFTRSYAVRSKKTLENKLFEAFNRINNEFKNIHSESEIQNQYLNKVINILDSGIIFYKADSGNVIWINEAFKDLFQTPHLVNIKGLKKRNNDLYEKTIAIKAGKSQVETIESSKGKIKLLIQTSEFKTKNGVFRIVHYQNINEAMDETESKAYHKLLRVLTHEIMNSIAPIASLANSLHERLENIENNPALEDIKVGIYTIKNRSEGLIQFSKSYRLLNKIDTPKRENVSILHLFELVNQLLEPVFIKENIDFDVIIKNTKLVLYIDINLIEQVLINLILNAKEAVKDVDNPRISLTAVELDGSIQIRVKDNGIGISEELQEQIFTPFFTTKKTGTGVGLALSKQIMLAHNGNINVESRANEGSIFTLFFLPAHSF